MTEPYSPIVRTFGQLRQAVLKTGIVDRNEIRPDCLLDDVIPPCIRRVVWKDLKAHGLRPPALELEPQDQAMLLVVLIPTTLTAALLLQSWMALFLVLPFACVLSFLMRNRAKSVSLGIQTVRELVIYLTRFRDHRKSGYRWTTSEIEMKVRLITAEALGVDLDEVQPDTTWLELTEC